MPFVVGLTGGIGSGKSAVANAFASLGVEIVDADLLAHRLSGQGQPGYAAIRAQFPDVELTPDGGELVVLPTYTAMLALQGIVADRGHAQPYWERTA